MVINNIDYGGNAYVDELNEDVILKINKDIDISALPLNIPLNISTEEVMYLEREIYEISEDNEYHILKCRLGETYKARIRNPLEIRLEELENVNIKSNLDFDLIYELLADQEYRLCMMELFNEV